MRKHVALVMAAALAASSLAGCSGKTSAPAETTAAAAETKAEETKAEESKAEETTAEAASVDELSEDELIEQAKAEGKVVIYSATSVMEKVAELFKAKYGIDVEVTQLGDSEMIEKVSSEAQAGVSGGADAILCQDGARVISELITPGYTQNYLSSRITDVVPEEDQNPLVFQFCNKVFIFNNEKVDDTAYTNIWQFTDPQYKGLLQMKDANSEGVNMNFFTIQKYFTGSDLGCSKDCLHNLCTSCSNKTRERYDLTSVGMETNIFKYTFSRKVFNAKYLFLRGMFRFYISAQLTSYHTVDNGLLTYFIYFILSNFQSITEDRTSLADDWKLCHTMCYINHGSISCLHLLDLLKKRINLFLRK